MCLCLSSSPSKASSFAEITYEGRLGLVSEAEVSRDQIRVFVCCSHRTLNTVVTKSDRPTVRTSRNAGCDAERQITGRNSK